MHVNPLSEQLVPLFHCSELLYNFSTNMFHALLNHMNPPGNYYSHKFSLRQYRSSLPLLLLLEFNYLSKSFHSIENLHFSDSLKLLSCILLICSLFHLALFKSSNMVKCYPNYLFLD